MSNILIINAHEPSPFSEGKLNAALVEKARTTLESKGHEVRVVTMQDEIVVDEQLAHFEWADRVILQSPVNWMTIPWSFKKYMDDVFTAGMGERYVHLMVAAQKNLRRTTVRAALALTQNTCCLSHSMHLKSHLMMKMNIYSKVVALMI